MRANGLAVLMSVVLLATIASEATATTAAEATAWLQGRWSNNGDCNRKWVEFTRSGSNWTYREIQLNRGKPYPAKVAVDGNGVATVQISSEDGDVYQYVNMFQNRNRFDAVESFVAGPSSQGPTQGRTMKFTYNRCGS